MFSLGARFVTRRKPGERQYSGIYALLNKREVKMAGYWPSSFFAFFVEVHKNR